MCFPKHFFPLIGKYILHKISNGDTTYTAKVTYNPRPDTGPCEGCLPLRSVADTWGHTVQIRWEGHCHGTKQRQWRMRAAISKPQGLLSAPGKSEQPGRSSGSPTPAGDPVIIFRYWLDQLQLPPVPRFSLTFLSHFLVVIRNYAPYIKAPNLVTLKAKQKNQGVLYISPLGPVWIRI